MEWLGQMGTKFDLCTFGEKPCDPKGFRFLWMIFDVEWMFECMWDVLGPLHVILGPAMSGRARTASRRVKRTKCRG